MNSGQNKCCYYCKSVTKCQLVVLFNTELFSCFPCSAKMHEEGNIAGVHSKTNKKGNMQSSTTSSPGDSDDAPPGKKVFIDELLCFLQNKNDFTTTELLVDVCCGFYSEDTIKDSKLFIYEQVETKHRLVHRRGPDRKQDNVRDIIRVLKEMEPTDETTFVAVNLANIPPFYMESRDCKKLMGELGELREEIKAMHLKQDAMAKIISSQPAVSNTDRKEKKIASSAKQTGKVNKPPPIATNPASTTTPPPAKKDTRATAKANMSDAASHSVASSSSSAATAVSDVADTAAGASSAAVPATAAATADQNVAPRSRTSSNSSDPVVNAPCFSDNSAHATNESLCDADISSDDAESDHSSSSSRPSYKSALMNGQFKFEKGWSVKRNKKQDKPNAAQNKCNLKAIGPKPEKGQRKCVGVFLSRLEAHHSAEDINTYLLQLGVRSKATKIPLTSKIHSSFFIKCNKSIREKLLAPDTWPTGVYVKRYFE